MKMSNHMPIELIKFGQQALALEYSRRQRKLWIEMIIAFFVISLAVGYTFTELNQFNSAVHTVLAP